MGHLTHIEGTNYDITGGKTLISGTSHDISFGKTLRAGTVENILFISPADYWIPLQTGSIASTSSYGRATISMTNALTSPVVVGFIGSTSNSIVYPVAIFIFKLAPGSSTGTLFVWNDLYYRTNTSTTVFYPIINSIQRTGNFNIGASSLGPIQWNYSSIGVRGLDLYAFAYTGPNESYGTSKYDSSYIVRNVSGGTMLAVGGDLSQTPAATPTSVWTDPTQPTNNQTPNTGWFMRCDLNLFSSLTGYSPGSSTANKNFDFTSSSVYNNRFSSPFLSIIGGESSNSGNYTWFEYK